MHSFYRPHKRSDTWYTGEVADPKTGELVKLPSMTKQSFVAECDINTIMKQYKKTGMISHVSAHAAQGAYLDLPDATDFQQSLELVKEATIAFNTLPSKVRERFANDPARFLAFCGDPANRKEMGELGLTIPSNPVQVPPVPAPQAPDKAPPPVSPPAVTPPQPGA